MLRLASPVALLLVVLAVSLLPLQAVARGKARASGAQPALKDCTRFNARFGYYGNPWCTPAEQRAWDRAARRAR